VSDEENVDRAADLVQQVVPRVRRFLARGLQQQKLTLQQLHVLGAIAGGTRSSGAIATELAVRLPTLTGLVTPLCSRGLVVRERDPDNRRCVVLELTPAGEAAWAGVYAVAHARAAVLVATLTPGERADIIGALRMLDRAVAVHDADRHEVAPDSYGVSDGLAQSVQGSRPHPQTRGGQEGRLMSSSGRLHE
jgi:DNA-binding MarR family transcriptional regulator